ncbi:MAG: hypothetical protein IAF08_07350 [Rhizobacter sp.]|nr:hypothetical protein [Chlorobiales bacterium]
MKWACTLICTAVALNTSALYAQDTIPETPLSDDDEPFFYRPLSDSTRYHFINYHLNKLSFYGSGRSSFEKVFEKMDSLLIMGRKSKEQIHVLHFGGSHIQADVWPGRVRERLRYFSPETKGARGFIFPQKLGRSNGSRSFEVQFTGLWTPCRNTELDKQCAIGLAGISVMTYDSSSLDITLINDHYPQYRYTLARIFHNTDSTSFAIDVVDSAFTVNRTINYEAGYTEFALPSPATKLRLRFTRRDSIQKNFTLYGIDLENEDAGFRYHAVGVNGARVPSYLRCTLLAKELKTIDPQLVVLSIGINDAKGKEFNPVLFESQYDQLVKRIKQVSPDAAILFTTNTDSFRRIRRRRYAVNKNAVVVREVMLRLAKKHNAAVWDLFNVMGGLGSINQWKKIGLAKKDRIHFSREGYTIIGDLMYDAFINAYNSRKEQAARK